MKTKNAVITLSLIMVLLIGSFTVSFASYYDGGNPTTQENVNMMCAYALHDMGLFQGTDNGFELNNKATRLQGIVMFIRILGQENAAVAGGADTTFTDVPAWGKAYTAYAEQQGLSNGLGNGKFGSANLMTAKDYATFLLRGLGYSDKNGDFTYADSVDYMKEIGAVTESECDYLKTNDFKRGEMALLSYRALSANLKGTDTPLVEKLGLGTVLEANYKGTVDGRDCNFQIRFNDISRIKGANKVYYQPLGYDSPLDNCFTYRQLSKDYKTIFYTPISEIGGMTYGAASDNGTQGGFTQGFVICDGSGNELALVRFYAAQENQSEHQEKFIATAFPAKYPSPKVIVEGINYDKSSGFILLDKQKITGQIGEYTKIYSSYVKWPFDDTNGYLPETAINAINVRNGMKTYQGDVSSITVDPSKYYHVLLFINEEGNPVGCKTLEK